MMSPELWVCHLGTVEYRDALALQERVRAARQQDELPDVLLTLEHWPVYTRGRRSAPGELPMGEEWYRCRGSRSSRPIAAARSPTTGPASSSATRSCASTTCRVRAHARAGARRRARPRRASPPARRTDDGPDFTGVWVGERKIASIGVHVSRGVTTHGFAVNVENDLQPFRWIVPCGLDGVQMTSLIKETGRLAGQMKCFRRRAAWQRRAGARAGASGWSASTRLEARRRRRRVRARSATSDAQQVTAGAALAGSSSRSGDLAPGGADRPPADDGRAAGRAGGRARAWAVSMRTCRRRSRRPRAAARHMKSGGSPARRRAAGSSRLTSGSGRPCGGTAPGTPPRARSRSACCRCSARPGPRGRSRRPALLGLRSSWSWIAMRSNSSMDLGLVERPLEAAAVESRSARSSERAGDGRARDRADDGDVAPSSERRRAVDLDTRLVRGATRRRNA